MQIIAQEKDNGKRLDLFLAEQLLDLSRSKIQKLIRSGQCLVNNAPVSTADYRLRQGQKIRINLEAQAANPEAEQGDTGLVWHDDDLLVCDKPVGLTVHPCPSCPENTLVQRLLSDFPQLRAQGGERPGIVHRLDKDTSGLILVALNEKTRLELSRAFAERRISKTYLALVAGIPPRTGECLKPVGRNPVNKTSMAIVAEKNGGRFAHSSWQRLWSAPDQSFSLLAITLHTGRTHQIRVHMAYLGHPLLGDQLYAPASIRALAPRQMLHAWKLEFTHLATGQIMRFATPPPQDFSQTILDNCQQAVDVVVTGNQGCGKSTFCGELAALGLPLISADAIVGELYAVKSPVTDWLEIRGLHDAIAQNGSIIKPTLLQILESSPEIKREFENFVHALVKEKIGEFRQRNKHKLASIAEVPLYFESGWQKQSNPPFVVGIHCDQSNRWQRIRQNRGWDDQKIATLESWQIPEDEKMALCDRVYNNNGPENSLAEAAKDFLAFLEARQKGAEKALLKEITALYNS